jgi:hypothetical protein
MAIRVHCFDYPLTVRAEHATMARACRSPWGKMRQHIVSGSGGSIRCQKCFNQRPAYFAGGLYVDAILPAFSCAALNSAPV